MPGQIQGAEWHIPVLMRNRKQKYGNHLRGTVFPIIFNTLNKYVICFPRNNSYKSEAAVVEFTLGKVKRSEIKFT